MRLYTVFYNDKPIKFHGMRILISSKEELDSFLESYLSYDWYRSENLDEFLQGEKIDVSGYGDVYHVELSVIE